MGTNRVVYLEPFSGISGDMMVGALLDCGLDADRVAQHLRRLPLEGYRICTSKCSRAGIQATKFDVQVEADPHRNHHAHSGHAHRARNFRDIRGMIETSGLSDWVKTKSVEAFLRLAVAEGKIHNLPPDEVHFHEVGAVDSIVDIVGCMIAMEELLPARIISGPVNVGHGTLECRHGIYPVPGPAAQELLRGMPTYSNAVGGELTTPTGATLLASLAEGFGPRPMMRIEATGYGAGARDIPGSANVLRITIGEEASSEDGVIGDETVAVIEATIDDMSPQLYGYFQEKALAEGALDVYLVPVQMKKNRPGCLVTVLCAPEQLETMIGIIFAETTTIGLRHTITQRTTLQREMVSVATEFGPVRVKVSSHRGRPVNIAPEFEDCRRVAAEKKVPLKDVMAAAIRSFQGERTL